MFLRGIETAVYLERWNKIIEFQNFHYLELLADIFNLDGPIRRPQIGQFFIFCSEFDD